MFRRDMIWDSRGWCEGFLLGLDFAGAQWLALQRQRLEWFPPFVMLRDEEMHAGAAGPEYVQRWEAAIPSILVQMHAYWRECRDSPTPSGISQPVHEPQRPVDSKDWAQRSLSMRQRAQIQEMLRRESDRTLTSTRLNG